MKKMNEQILADYAQQLLGIDSPTGFTQHAIAWIEEQVQALGYTCYRNAKGNLIVEIEGPADQPVVAVSAHTDTLGLMVRAIKKDGKLAFTRLGGPCLPTLDGEYCRIITRQGKVYTGTILSTAPAVHVYKEASSQERSEETMEVRIDELVRNEEDVRQLGIQAGDIIAIDPKTTITPSGFIKSDDQPADRTGPGSPAAVCRRYLSVLRQRLRRGAQGRQRYPRGFDRPGRACQPRHGTDAHAGRQRGLHAADGLPDRKISGIKLNFNEETHCLLWTMPNLALRVSFFAGWGKTGQFVSLIQGQN